MNCIVHGILQARILEWVAIPFSRGSSQPRDRTQVSHIASGFFTSWATREVLEAEWIRVNVWLSSFAVHLKLSQHCVVLVYSVLYSVFFFLWLVLAAQVVFAVRGLSLAVAGGGLWGQWGASPLAACRLSSCVAWAQVTWGSWNLPGPGIKPTYPVPAGRFLTTGPPGKSYHNIVNGQYPSTK